MRTTSPSTLAATCTQRLVGSVELEQAPCRLLARSARNANTKRPGPNGATAWLNQLRLDVVVAPFRPTTPSTQLCSLGVGDQRIAIAESSWSERPLR